MVVVGFSGGRDGGNGGAGSSGAWWWQASVAGGFVERAQQDKYGSVGVGVAAAMVGHSPQGQVVQV